MSSSPTSSCRPDRPGSTRAAESGSTRSGSPRRLVPGAACWGSSRPQSASRRRASWSGKRLDVGRLEFREGDATALAMKDGSLDWVSCGDVLHHVLDTDKALSEFRRVVRPGGRVVVKESPVLSAMFLPGHPELERRIQLAEIARSLDEGGGRSFQERRQTTLASLRAAGLADIAARTYLIERRAPLTAAAREYIQNTVFDRNWGERLRPLLSAEDWSLRTAVCEPGSPRNALASPDYYCLYPVTVFTARVPAR